MVDAYFHPKRMTYPIQPEPFFRAAPNWGKPAKLSLPQNILNRTNVLTLHSSRSIGPWGKPSNLWASWVYSLRPRVPSWTWIRYIQSATHRNTFKSPLTLAMSTAMRNPLSHPATSSMGNIFWRLSCFSPTTTRTTHSWVTTSFLSLTSKLDFCYTFDDHISLRH